MKAQVSASMYPGTAWPHLGGACYPTARNKVPSVLAQGSVSLPEPPVDSSAPFLQDVSLLPHLLLYQEDIPGLTGSL